MSDTDSASADQTIEQRVKATVRYRDVAKKVESALAPVDATLRDLQSVLQIEGKRIEGDLPRFAITELRIALQSFDRAVVKRLPDGSWSMSRTVDWPFERTVGGQACQTSQIEMRGGEGSWDSSHSGTIFVYVNDCSVGEATLLASLSVDEKGAIHADFDSSSKIDLKDTTVRADRCTVEIASASSAAVDCKPFTASAFGASLRFDGLSFQRSHGVEALQFTVRAYKSEDGSPIAGGTISQSPGERVKFTRLPKESL